MSVRADAETLRRISLFRDCDDVSLQVLCFASDRVAIAPQNTIIAEGDDGEAGFLILQGQAILSGNGKVFGTAEAGSLLGETAMISGATYSITATAETEVQTARFTRELFQRVATEYPSFSRAVLAALSDKLGRSNREFDALRVALNKGRIGRSG